LIVVGIECSHEDGERLREYCPYSVDTAHFGQIDGYGDHFMDWLVNELKPFIDDNYPTIAGRVGTAIAGSSMGGLMAYYAAVVYNQIFSKAAALSPAFGFCFDELVAELARQSIDQDTRLYLSFGDQEVNEGRLDQASYLEQAFLDRGGETYMHLAAGGDHSEATWAAQNHLYMDFLWH
ncbi:alpha/beta hydrolase, partial [Aerococcus sp. L_4]